MFGYECKAWLWNPPGKRYAIYETTALQVAFMLSPLVDSVCLKVCLFTLTGQIWRSLSGTRLNHIGSRLEPCDRIVEAHLCLYID